MTIVMGNKSYQYYGQLSRYTYATFSVPNGVFSAVCGGVTVTGGKTRADATRKFRPKRRAREGKPRQSEPDLREMR
jgi:hypothetical protein